MIGAVRWSDKRFWLRLGNGSDDPDRLFLTPENSE
jgi:hypothetical protein